MRQEKTKALFWNLLRLMLLGLSGVSLTAAPRLLPGITFTPEEVQLIAKKYGESFDMVENLRAQQILLNALEASRQASWRCSLSDPVLPGNLVGRPCVFLRYMAPDGFVFRRLDCLDDGGKPGQSFVENRSGQFAKLRGRWVKISEILALWHLDALSEGFIPAEILDSVYSVRDADYRGIPCHEVSMRTLPNINTLSRQVGEMFLPALKGESGREWDTEMGRNRPMLRVFLIDKANGFIYSREHFNIGGAKLYSRKTGIVEIGGEFREKQFEPDGKITGDFLFPDEADNELFKQEQAALSRKSATRLPDDEVYPWHSRFADRFFDERVMRVVRIVTRVVAVALVAWAVVLKARQK